MSQRIHPAVSDNPSITTSSSPGGLLIWFIQPFPLSSDTSSTQLLGVPSVCYQQWELRNFLLIIDWFNCWISEMMGRKGCGRGRLYLLEAPDITPLLEYQYSSLVLGLGPTLAWPPLTLRIEAFEWNSIFCFLVVSEDEPGPVHTWKALYQWATFVHLLNHPRCYSISYSIKWNKYRISL